MRPVRNDFGVLDGPLRIELESFEFQQTEVGVKHAAPEGHHDDCAVALALAAERSRRYTPVIATWVGGEGPPPKEIGDVHQWFIEQRKDPEWGWEGSDRVSPADRYGRSGDWGRGRYN